MKTIYKYPLRIADEQEIYMPDGAIPLSVQMQGDHACLWVLVDPDRSQCKRRILIHGTGHSIEEDGIKYIATFQMSVGALVFHAFEAPSTKGSENE